MWNTFSSSKWSTLWAMIVAYTDIDVENIQKRTSIMFHFIQQIMEFLHKFKPYFMNFIESITFQYLFFGNVIFSVAHGFEPEVHKRIFAKDIDTSIFFEESVKIFAVSLINTTTRNIKMHRYFIIFIPRTIMTFDTFYIHFEAKKEQNCTKDEAVMVEVQTVNYT